MSPNTSEGSDDGMDVDLEEISDAQVELLRAAVIPTDVSTHLALIKAYRSRGDLEEMRTAYEALIALSVLPADAWLQWLRDEQSAGGDGEEEDVNSNSRSTLQKLFDRAVVDWPVNVAIWMEYAQWATGIGSVDGTREVFERAMNSCGVHVSRGILLWETYRLYETALLQLIDADADATSHKKQRARIDSLFRRQLRLPLLNAEDTPGEFREFLGVDQLPADVTEWLSTAKEQLKGWAQWEDVLADEQREEEHLHTYASYIEHALSVKDADMARTQMTFERALDRFPVDYKLWQRYTQWVGSKLKVNSMRACRHMPRVPHLWRGAILAAERASCPNEEIDAILTKAYVQYTKPEHGHQLWMEYVGVTRRRAEKEQGGVLTDFSPVLRTFEWGVECMKHMQGERWDDGCRFRRQFADYMAYCAKDLPTARKIWEDIMGAGEARLAGSWMEYLAMVRHLESNTELVRKAYSRALNSASDYPDVIYDALIEFERTSGTLATLDAANDKIAVRRQKVNQMFSAREAKAVARHHHEEEHKNVSPPKNRKQLRQEARDVAEGKGARPAVAPTPKLPATRPSTKREAPKTLVDPPVHSPAKQSKDNDGFAVPSVPKPSAKPVDPKPKPPTKPSNPSGANATPIGGAPQTSESERNSRTVFVSNLDFGTSADRIKEMFALSGKVTEVRLAGLHGGRHRGFAYVEMGTQEEAKTALNCDRDCIDHRPMYVSLYNPKSKDAPVDKSKSAMPFGTGLQTNKLFVRGLPPQATLADVEEIFKCHPGFTRTRLVTHKSGQSKGMAYIEFDSEANAAHALEKTQGAVVLGRSMTVAVSNPPLRRDARHTEQFTPSQQRSRLQLAASITPRNVQVKTVQLPPRRKPGVVAVPSSAREAEGTVAKESVTVTDTTSQARLTNEQFRQMFLKS